METEQMIRLLRRLEKEHQNDVVYTFQIRWADVCHDVANRLEELNEKCQSTSDNVKHGRWIEWTGMRPPEFAGRHRCSLCAGKAPCEMLGRERLTEWCPECGAHMDELDADQQDACYEHTSRDCNKCDHIECKYKHSDS